MMVVLIYPVSAAVFYPVYKWIPTAASDFQSLTAWSSALQFLHLFYFTTSCSCN